MGGVDVLVNNAGIPKRRNVRALDAATVDTVMQVNFLGPIRLTLALLPQMLERGAGHIVNVSSVAATLSSPGEAAYDASKSALAVFSEAMAIDLWDNGVKVLVVYPGVVDTAAVPDARQRPVHRAGRVHHRRRARAGRPSTPSTAARSRCTSPSTSRSSSRGRRTTSRASSPGTAEYMRQQAAGS